MQPPAQIGDPWQSVPEELVRIAANIVPELLGGLGPLLVGGIILIGILVLLYMGIKRTIT